MSFAAAMRVSNSSSAESASSNTSPLRNKYFGCRRGMSSSDPLHSKMSHYVIYMKTSPYHHQTAPHYIIWIFPSTGRKEYLIINHTVLWLNVYQIYILGRNSEINHTDLLNVVMSKFKLG